MGGVAGAVRAAVGGAVVAGALLRGGRLADPAREAPVGARPTADLNAAGA